MRGSLHPLWAGALLVSVTLSGCDASSGNHALADGGSSGDSTDGCANVGYYFAQQADFDGFTSWTKFDLGSDAGGDELGNVGDRVVYINRLPPHGSTTFPVRTILVKTAGYGTSDAGPTFAMVKQGRITQESTECFNADGAAGWVWMQIVPTSTGATISWHGAAQPITETYGASGISCNACHAGAASNDYVPAAELSLTNF